MASKATTTELTVAIVGCSALGSAHLTTWANMIGVRVAAVCDGNAPLAARTAEAYIGVAAFSSLPDALRSADVDIVDVCLPPTQQAETLEYALQQGCHVLCDKPLTYDLDAARRLCALANAKERLLMPGFAHRFYAPTLLASEMAENDDFGRILRFRALFSGLWEEAETERSGDVLSETATHGIDLFRAFCGEIVTSAGRLATSRPELEAPDTAVLLLESNTGALGTVEASWSAPGGQNRLEIYGSAGAAIIDYSDETLRYLTAEQPVWHYAQPSGPNRYERLLAHFADSVRGLQTPVLKSEDAVRALEICADIRLQNPS